MAYTQNAPRVTEIDAALAAAYKIEGNSFIDSVRGQHHKKGSISQKQYYSVLSAAKKLSRPETVDLSGFRPTEEQTFIIDAVAALNGFLKVKAFAGTGKTTTLKALTNTLTGRVLYIVFNRANRIEAEEKMPRNVEVRTWNSLAFAAFGKQFAKDKRIMNSVLPVVSAIENRPELADLKKLSEGRDRAAAFVAIQTITKFCISSDSEITADHVPSSFTSRINGKKARDKAAKTAAFCARRVWDAMVARDSKLLVTHDVYMKLWALSKPDPNYDVIMVDEAQDTNDVCFGILSGFSSKKIILVGDSHQQIYGFRGATDSLEKSPGQDMFLTKSFRFGCNVASQANRILHILGEKNPLIGAGQIDGEIIQDSDDRGEDAVLCRGNAGVIREAIMGLDAGRNVAVVGGTDEAVKLFYASYDLFTGNKTDHPELAIFNNWDELVEYSETEDGRTLAPIVRIVEKERGNTPNLCRRLKWEVVDEADADLIVSTAHKSKGREWDKVRLANDFPQIVEAVTEDGNEENIIGATLHKEEANLLYVAITRAMKRLNLSDNGFLIEDSTDLYERFLNKN